MVLIVFNPPPCVNRFSPLPISPLWRYLFRMKFHRLCVFCSSRNLIPDPLLRANVERRRRPSAFPALPGGFGTRDEFFEILTWKQLGLHAKPIVVANTGGWFDPILSFFRHAENQRMVSRENLALAEVVGSADLVVDALLRRRDQHGARR